MRHVFVGAAVSAARLSLRSRPPFNGALGGRAAVGVPKGIPCGHGPYSGIGGIPFAGMPEQIGKTGRRDGGPYRSVFTAVGIF